MRASSPSRGFYERAVTVRRELGDAVGKAMAAHNLAHIAAAPRATASEAEALLLEAFDESSTIGDSPMRATSLAALGPCAGGRATARSPCYTEWPGGLAAAACRARPDRRSGRCRAAAAALRGPLGAERFAAARHAAAR